VRTRQDNDRETVRAITAALVDCLLALGRDGRPETANRLAGRAWAALRHRYPVEARRINALMHGLAQMPSDSSRDHGGP